MCHWFINLLGLQGRLGVGLSDSVVCKSVVIPVSSAQNQRTSPQKNVLLTMIGIVLALERICLTKRYLSYNGFITCRSFLVTWKGKSSEIHEACSRFSTLIHMPVIAVSQWGPEWNFERMTGLKLVMQVLMYHCISCPRCQMKQHPSCGVSCTVPGGLNDQLSYQMSTAQNDP